jgi:hypothetical protein
MIECSIMLWGMGEMEVGETMNVLPLGVVGSAVEWGSRGRELPAFGKETQLPLVSFQLGERRDWKPPPGEPLGENLSFPREEIHPRNPLP